MPKRLIYTFLFYLFAIPVKSQTVSPIIIESGLVHEDCNHQVSITNANENCYTGITGILARSVNAEGLSNWLIPDACWGFVASTDYPEIQKVSQTRGKTINCMPPYDRCWNNYCPEKYVQIIQSFIDLKATFILRASNTWGKCDFMYPGTPFYKAMQQLVIDVNAAYDCAGLQRPIIQNTIFEFAEFKSKNVYIPIEVLNAYKDDPDFDDEYYLNNEGESKNKYFTTERVINGDHPFPNSPDISKIEGRMWMWYCAKMYIDMGYTSIHLGQMQNWAKRDKNFFHTIQLIRKIRSYAQSKRQICLLTEENYKAFKIPGTDTFLFDYDSRAIRPREVSDPVVCGDWHCNTPLFNYLEGSPCALEKYPAVIDQCVVEHYGNSSGYSPSGKCYMTLMPYTTYFDFSFGIHPPEGIASSGCESKDNTWGYDDTKWLVQKISPECRYFIITDAVSRIRTFSDGHGFFTLPALISVLNPEQYDNSEKGINPTAMGSYLLSDEPQLMKSLIDLWQPKSEIKISQTEYYKNFWGNYKPLGSKSRKNVYHRISIDNTDNTSVYSWFIMNQSGDTIATKGFGDYIFKQLDKTSETKVVILQTNFGGFNDSKIQSEHSFTIK